MFKKITFLFIFLITLLPLNAQQVPTDTVSKVVISEQSLVSLINTLKQYKQETQRASMPTVSLPPKTDTVPTTKIADNDVTKSMQLLLGHIDALNARLDNNPQTTQQLLYDKKVQHDTVYIIQSNLKQTPQLAATPEQEFSDSEIAGTNLNSQIQDLKYQVAKLQQEVSKLSNDDTMPVEPQQQPSGTKVIANISDNGQQLQLIEQQIDSLKGNYVSAIDNDSLKYLNTIDSLQNRLQQLKATKDTVMIVKTIEKEIPVATPSNYVKQVFFDNNDSTIGLNEINLLHSVADILKADNKSNILLRGFASNIGSTIYNRQLSLERTESIKKALINMGIEPSRIITQHLGIDYTKNNAILARRVDISLLSGKN